MSDQSAHEPTMEEILASIRRIISEDDAPAEEKAAEPEEEPVAEAAPEPVAEAEDEEEDVLELTDVASDSVVSIGDLDAYEPAAAPRAPEPEPLPLPTFDAPEPVAASGRLVSDVTASSAATAFSASSSSLLMPSEGRTIEDLLRELLQPMLKQWLDANLPAIVEEQVRQEVERISRQSRR